jgi:Flp pilus assembly protein TadD
MSLDGALGSSFGDKAQSEELAGHLGALLSPKSEAQILIGDWMGNALRGIAAHPPGLTHVAVSSVYALRSIANMDPVRQRLWLQPGHPLYGEFSASLTRRTPSVGSIIEINHSPWTSGANWGLDDGHISAIKAHLSPDGVYVLCVHMRWWADGALSQIAGALTTQFQSVTTWLPPEGVDSIIFVASDKAATYKALASGFDHARAALLSLGFQSPEMLAGAAILGQNSTRVLGALDHPPLRPDRLSAGLFDRPTLHLSHAPELMKDQVDPWNGTAPPGVAEVRSAKATLLTMLSSATQGHLEGAFEAARALSNAHGATGKQALARVIEPHIRNARTALRHARSADPNSSKWDDAIRFATTARMLSPKSHTPLTLLGDIALARGFLPMALEHYKQALKIKPNHVPALEGLARCARLGDEPKKVGQALRDATHHAPRDWRTWHNLAVFHLENDDNTAAMTAIESALGLAPSEEVAPLLVLIKTQLRSGAAGAALLRADQVTKLAPKNGLGWYLRGRAHFDLDRMVEAENDFRQAVLIDGELIEARSGIGLVRAILGDEESARRIFKDVLEKDPANAAARENLRRLSGNAKP